MQTCAVELQGRQDLGGVQLHSQRRHVEAPAIALGVHALQEHRPGPADQVDQSILQGGESESDSRTQKHTHAPLQRSCTSILGKSDIISQQRH